MGGQGRNSLAIWNLLEIKRPEYGFCSQKAGIWGVLECFWGLQGSRKAQMLLEAISVNFLLSVFLK